MDLNYISNKVLTSAGQKYRCVYIFVSSLKNAASSCLVAVHQSCEVSNFQQLMPCPGIPFVQSKAG